MDGKTRLAEIVVTRQMPRGDDGHDDDDDEDEEGEDDENKIAEK